MQNSIQKPVKYSKIHGWFDFEDLYAFEFDKLKDSAHIVEVGCWLGKSACFMGELIKNSKKSIRFDCIDTWRHPRTEWSDPLIKGNKQTQVFDFVNNLDAAGVLENLNVIQLSSLEVVNIYPDKSLDFVFLDNDHSEDHVLNELNAWWPKIKKGGILAGHDYHETEWPGVVNAVQKFGKKHRIKYEVQVHSYIFRR